MTDKVQKIREWVKARLDENSSKQSLPQFYCMMEEDARFLGFLYFLDTMQEEHDEIVDKYLYGKEPELVDADNLPKEEPVSEDLGDYINELSKQFPEVSFAKLSRIAVRVAKWQKEQIKKAMDLGEPPYLISIEQAYYRTLKLLEE